jgi:hypothetical protein
MQPEKQMLAQFRQGNSPMATNAIDYYRQGDEIIKHEWSMGGESKEVVASVPDLVIGYYRLDDGTEIVGIKLPKFPGWQYTGEYRRPRDGEYFLYCGKVDYSSGRQALPYHILRRAE